MMKNLLSALMLAFAGAAFAAPANTWTMITDVSEINENDEYIIAYTFPNGIYQVKCDVMTYNIAGSNRGFYVIGDCDLNDNTISGIGSEAAVVKLVKNPDASTYAIYLTNGPTKGYLAPTTGNGIQIVSDPHYAKFSFGMGPVDDSGTPSSFTAKVSFVVADDNARSAFSWVNTPIGGAMTHVFWVCMQAESGGTLGFYKKNPLAANENWTATPEDGSKLDLLDTFTFTFPEAKSISKGTGTAAATVDGAEVAAPEFTVDGKSAVAKYAEPLNRQGKYQITLPAGFFNVELDDNTVKPTPEMTNELNLNGVSPEQKYTLSPEAGTFNTYPEITVAYTDATAITLAEGAKATLSVDNAGATTTYDVNIAAEGNVVTLTTAEPVNTFISDNATYTLNVPADSYTITYANGTFGNAALAITDYKLHRFNPVKSVTAEPAPGKLESTEALYNPSLTIESDYAFMGLLSSPRIQLTVAPADGGAEAIVGNYSVAENVDGKLSLVLTPTLEADKIVSGHYTILVPAGVMMFNVDGRPVKTTEAYEFEYDVELTGGIEAIISNADSFDVFTSTGVCVLRGASRAQFEALPAGFYIANGVKIIKK